MRGSGSILSSACESSSASEASVELELTMAPALRAVKARLEEKVRSALVSRVLAWKLDGTYGGMGRQVDALLRDEAAAAAADVDMPMIPQAAREGDAPLAEEVWHAKLLAAREEVTEGSFVRELIELAPTCAESIAASTAVVIDSNVPPLLEHRAPLRDIRTMAPVCARRLDWIGPGLDWIDHGLGWIDHGLDWIGLAWIGLDWPWVGLD
jgi:hypothetical protein